MKKIREWTHGHGKTLTLLSLILAIALVVVALCANQCSRVGSNGIAEDIEEAEILGPEAGFIDVEADGIEGELNSDEHLDDQGNSADWQNIAANDMQIDSSHADDEELSSNAIFDETVSQVAPREQFQDQDAPSPSSTPEPEKRWVEETSQVWVVDQQAWTETVPIYENVERSICNVCGTDITGDTSAHSRQHMLAGERSGYHSEINRIQTDTSEVHHDEIGHWETVVAGGHWE